MIKQNEIENVISDITAGIKKATNIATVGLSGGADSTLIATLCVRALGKENVYGYGMPYDDNDVTTFNSRSAKLAAYIGCNYDTFNIHAAVTTAKNGMDLNNISPLNLGNIKSRMRMVFIYSLNAAIAEKTGEKCRVIGTGNMSEDFIGYDTKGGDALADLFPIGELYKSEVYQLLDYFVSTGELNDELIDRTPSAGLEDGQTDEQDLGYSYNEMEPIIKFCLANYNVISDDNYVVMDEILNTPIFKFVWNRHVANKHKHMAPPVITMNKGLFE